MGREGKLASEAEGHRQGETGVLHALGRHQVEVQRVEAHVAGKGLGVEHQHRESAEQVGRDGGAGPSRIVFQEVELGDDAEVVDLGFEGEVPFGSPADHRVLAFDDLVGIVQAERPAGVVVVAHHTAKLIVELVEHLPGVDIAEVGGDSPVRAHFEGLGGLGAQRATRTGEQKQGRA